MNNDNNEEILLLTKRDGRVEPYDEAKMLRVCTLACNGDDELARILLKEVNIKINNRMKVSSLFDAVIDTAANLTSELQPIWDEVSKNLMVIRTYKEVANLKTTGYYPKYSDLVEKALKSRLYNKEVFATFNEEEIDALGKMIDPNRDFIYTYKGLYIMNSKYCMKSGDRQMELPQHVYLRMAIFSFYKEDPSIRLKLIKKEYDAWSVHGATAGTPRVLNSSTPNSQLASCVLMTMADDTWSIKQTEANAATYSKFGGGLAIDVSHIRASGSLITGNRGLSNGPVPFIRGIEATICAFNQGGARNGISVVTFPFWHMDVMDLIMLKDAGGTEENRARKLQYSMRRSRLLNRRVRAGQKVTLFCPSDVPLLNSTYGEEFDKAYAAYEADNSIRKKTVSARKLMYRYAKVRGETGNVYGFNSDNVNEQSMVGDYIGASNLCTEITVTSKPSKFISSEIIRDEDGNDFIIEKKTAGEIGLCNLASINLVYWYGLTYEEKEDFIYHILRGQDNVLDYQMYPVKEAKYSNIRKRPIGIGVSNFTHLLANQGLKFTDDASLKFSHELHEDLYYHIYNASCKLAQERGPFEYFKNTRWAEGETPVSLSLLRKEGLDHPLNFPLLHDWSKETGLGGRIMKYGVRFSLHGAIAPTATSGKVISATESTEPLVKLFYYEEGTQTIPALAPNLIKNRRFYENAYDVPTSRIIEHGAVRQIFLDQSQSVNFYYPKPNSAKTLVKDMMYADDLYMKTNYYQRVPKGNYVDEKVCESCT